MEWLHFIEINQHWDFNLDPVKDENGKQASGDDITSHWNVGIIGLQNNNGREIDRDEWKEYGFINGDCLTKIIEGAIVRRKHDLEYVGEHYDYDSSITFSVSLT